MTNSADIGRDGFRRTWLGSPIARIGLAIALGAIVGEVAGARAEPLARAGVAILDLLKGLAGPLLFFAILDSALRTQIEPRDAAVLLGVSAINATIAIAIGLSLSNAIRPGDAFRALATPKSAAATVEAERLTRSLPRARTIDFAAEFAAILPTSIARPFVDNAILPLAIVAVSVGLALRRVGLEWRATGRAGYDSIEGAVTALYRAFEILIGWAVLLIPLAVFCVVARTVGLHGFGPFRGVGPYMAVGIAGLAIQILIVYQGWLALVAGYPLRRFWAGGREAVMTAVGTASSLATLPVTLRCLGRLSVSDRSARLAACVGTNLNNDGILLYEAMAVLFVAQAIGIELTIGQQLTAAAACIVAGIGISGIPDAGLISLVIVLGTVGLPAEATAVVLPFLLAVDWIMGRCRAVTNVISDMTVAIVIDRNGTTREGQTGASGDKSTDPSGI